jgi:hypothetical protein
MLVYDPSAPCHNQPRQARGKLDGLTGKIVGFIDNAKPNFNHLVDDLEGMLVGKFGVSAVIKRSKRGASMPAPDAVIAELSEQCDLVITGSGD